MFPKPTPKSAKVPCLPLPPPKAMQSGKCKGKGKCLPTPKVRPPSPPGPAPKGSAACASARKARVPQNPRQGQPVSQKYQPTVVWPAQPGHGSLSPPGMAGWAKAVVNGCEGMAGDGDRAQIHGEGWAFWVAGFQGSTPETDASKKMASKLLCMSASLHDWVSKW